MLRFLYVIFMNLSRAPYMIPKLRRMAKNREKYSEEQRYAYVKKAVHYMMKSGKITTEVYGTENLPKEGGYVMFPNHQGKYDALGIIGHARESSAGPGCTDRFLQSLQQLFFWQAYHKSDFSPCHVL